MNIDLYLFFVSLLFVCVFTYLHQRLQLDDNNWDSSNHHLKQAMRVQTKLKNNVHHLLTPSGCTIQRQIQVSSASCLRQTVKGLFDEVFSTPKTSSMDWPQCSNLWPWPDREKTKQKLRTWTCAPNI